MQFIEGEIYHIYNRGNNGQKIFFNKENYLFFLRKVQKELSPYCEIIAYCLMPNHFHLMASIKHAGELESSDNRSKRSLNTGIAILLRSYTRAIQTQENIKGSLFQQKTKAQHLCNHTGSGLNHPAVCMHYIHQNPLRAGLVSGLEDWEFSSFKDYAGLRPGSLCNKELGFSITGIEKERFIEESYNVITYEEEKK